MSKVALAVKYRPKTFSDVVEQDSTKVILQQQLESGEFQHSYLFVGGAGTGKTTCARIFANEINKGEGIPIELDAASNNGVDDVRNIIQQAKTKALDSEYKVFIIDECFPANTWIKLEKGYNRIDKIKVGDIVQSMSGYNKVAHIFKSSVLTSRLCCVIINNRKHITTSEHLFFTNNGWVKACDLQKGDIVYDAESLSKLWKEFSESSQECEVLLPPMFGGLSKENLSAKDKNSKMSDMWKRVSDTELLQNKDLFCGVQEQTDYEVEYTTSEYRVWQGTTETIIRAYEEEQPNERREEYTNDAEYKKAEWYTSPMERSKGWQQEVYHSTDSLIRSLRRWLDFRVPDTNELQEGRTSVSYVLQSRPWLSNNENCNRGRWQKPQMEKWIIERLKERGMSKKLRVDSVEIYKRGYNDELFLGSFTDTELSQREVIMYDLEVENDHTYFADDILVHNCHSLSNTAWQAFLKLIEEPPAKSIFIFATTNPEKIPKTILSRVQRYDFKRISQRGIVDRLEYILKHENSDMILEAGNRDVLNYDWDDDALEYVAKLSEGGMRDAITLMDKCLSYSKDLTIENIVKALGVADYDIMVQLVSNIVYPDDSEVIKIIEDIHNSGKDLKQFIRQLINFVLDIKKYIILKSYDYINIPHTDWAEGFLGQMEEDEDKVTDLLDLLIKINTEIKYDSSPKYMIEAMLIGGINDRSE